MDRHQEKRELANTFGADRTFDRGDKGINEISDIDPSKKLDAVIDAVGNPEIIHSSLPLIKRGGSICVYGFYAGLKEFTVPNSLGDFNYNIYIHQWPTRLYEKESQTTLCEWVNEGKLSGSEFISHRFNIKEIADALRAVHQRKVIKAVLSYD